MDRYSYSIPSSFDPIRSVSFPHLLHDVDRRGGQSAHPVVLMLPKCRVPFGSSLFPSSSQPVVWQSGRTACRDCIIRRIGQTGISARVSIPQGRCSGCTFQQRHSICSRQCSRRLRRTHLCSRRPPAGRFPPDRNRRESREARHSRTGRTGNRRPRCIRHGAAPDHRPNIRR